MQTKNVQWTFFTTRLAKSSLFRQKSLQFFVSFFIVKQQGSGELTHSFSYDSGQILIIKHKNKENIKNKLKRRKWQIK